MGWGEDGGQSLCCVFVIVFLGLLGPNILKKYKKKWAKAFNE